MEIIIGKPIVAKKYKNQYKIDIEFMHGDADGYANEEVFVNENNPNLKRFIQFLHDCIKAYPDGRGGYDDYGEKVMDWYYFCDEDCGDGALDGEESDKIEKFRKISGIHLEWPYDYDYTIQATLLSYKITYFDDKGIEYATKIKGYGKI